MLFPAEPSVSSRSSAPAARFSVSAVPTPCLVPRVLQPFAKRGLVPDEFHARSDGERQSIDIRVVGMAPDLAAYIGRCLRQILSVERVLVSAEEGAEDA